MKIGKALLSWLLTIILLITPFSGSIVFAADGIATANAASPAITTNITNFTYVMSDTVIEVTYAPSGDATLASCDTRLEGTSISAEASVSFTPADLQLESGVYTLVMEATDSLGVTAIDTLTFIVTDKIDIDFTYAEDESIVPNDPNATANTYEVESLDFTMGYGSTADGTVALEDVLPYDAYTTYGIQYMNKAVSLNSVSGIPYQTFDVALNGKTEGDVIVRYTGSTKVGERIAVKVYNPTTAAWDTIGTFTGSGSVSEAVDVATYADGDTIHVLAVLDYVTNGSDTMIWSTDPQHYTKFDDLHDFYYQVYQYAADEYVAGNVGYIITTGDLVDDLPNTTAAVKQWQVADQAMSFVEAVGMPNGLVSGNHDVGTVKINDYTAGDAAVNYSKYLEYFGADRYNNKPWYGGSLNDNISHYDLITIGNVDFVILYLGYGVEATDETIVWANNVLQTYSHRTAIVATHQYLEASTADRATDSRAQLIYDTIVDPNPNVKMVICGHDDGSIVREVTASDGRTVYELLSDYQFVEAEDPDFYENEHYIGSVPECCGDGYIRLLTVEGDTLSSITYSPVTNRYNPYGDRENITIDLNCGAADRELATVAFSAYVLGEEATVGDYTKETAIVITKTISSDTGEPAVVSEIAWPEDATYGEAATPDASYAQYAAKTAPDVEHKVDVLSAIGLSDGTVNTGMITYGNYALNLSVDLNKTPYLYYSIAMPAASNFTFAFVNNTTNAPWLLFRDATGEGAFMNNGAANWDAYTNREQYITTSETGCIDMRQHLTNSNNLTWIVNQVNFYNSVTNGVVIGYMFFGSEPITVEEPDLSEPITVTTYHHVSYISYPETPEAGTNVPVDLAALNALVTEAEAIGTAAYTEETAISLASAIADAKAVDATSDAEVKTAYVTLANAIGALEEPVETIDPSTLQSVYVYDLTTSNWTTSDVTMTQLSPTGINVARNTTNGWASINRATSYTIKANNGKIYLNLDVEADCAWCIYVVASQANVSGNIRMNFAIDNAFNRTDADSFDGDYKGVYDVTEAFVAAGMDPSATITISSTSLFVVPGENAPTVQEGATDYDTVNYNYIEYMTDVATTDAVDTAALQALINSVAEFDEALYTVNTWKSLQTALTSANATLNNTDAAQADVNLAVIKLQNAIDKLKLLTDVIPEPEGSLLPADESNWNPSASGTMNIYRDENNYTTLQNTNSQWPYADYTLVTPVETTVADHQISVDLTVGDRTNIYINVTGIGWVPLPKYISAAKTNGDGDLTAGTYTVDVPLSSISEINGKETITINTLRIYTIGNAASSAVTVRKMMITDYVAPPPVEEELANLMPAATEDVTILSGDGTVSIENGVLTAVNNGDTDLRLSFSITDLYNMNILNALHLDIETEIPFKMAWHILSHNDGTGAWPNSSSAVYSHLFTVTDDRAAAGEYDVYMEMRDNCGSISDKSAVYHNQFIIVLTGQGTFTLNLAEAVAYDTFVWSDNITYGDAATPDNPYYEHAAKDAPEVEEKVDLMPYFNSGLHPTVGSTTLQTAGGLGIEIDLNKTPYLYYSFAVPEGADFTFSLYSDATYSPWLSFLDSNIGDAVMNMNAANWDAYKAREQYATTSQTGCIDMRDYLKDPAVLKWVINQMKFYAPKGDNSVVVSYFFFGSEPVAEVPDVLLGDVNNDGEVDIFDAMDVYMHADGSITLSEEAMAVADYNEDGSVDIFDAMELYLVASGV